jgi:hypothetical protein
MSEILPDIGIHTDYTDPVRRLLGIGASPANAPAEWPDYAATYGLGSEHGAELGFVAKLAGWPVWLKLGGSSFSGSADDDRVQRKPF